MSKICTLLVLMLFSNDLLASNPKEEEEEFYRTIHKIVDVLRAPDPGRLAFESSFESENPRHKISAVYEDTQLEECAPKQIRFEDALSDTLFECISNYIKFEPIDFKIGRIIRRSLFDLASVKFMDTLSTDTLVIHGQIKVPGNFNQIYEKAIFQVKKTAGKHINWDLINKLKNELVGFTEKYIEKRTRQYELSRIFSQGLGGNFPPFGIAFKPFNKDISSIILS